MAPAPATSFAKLCLLSTVLIEFLCHLYILANGPLDPSGLCGGGSYAPASIVFIV